MNPAAEIWERRLESIMPAIPLALLVFSTFGATVLDSHSAPGPTLAWSAVALAWLLLRKRLAPAIFVAGLVAVAAVLVVRSPIYGFFVFSC